MVLKKKEKRIVSPAVKEVSPVTSMIPTLKTAMIPENVFHPGGAVAKNNTTLRDEEAERAEIRKKAGLTYEQLCETVAKGLMAMVCNAETGEPICPANSERAKFVAVAVDMLGARRAEVGAQKCPQINIHLPPGFSFK
jgi:hypothetical protein